MALFKKKDVDPDTPKQVSYLIPGALVTTLFFLWGFSYGLLDTLNKHFRNVLGISIDDDEHHFGALWHIHLLPVRNKAKGIVSDHIHVQLKLCLPVQVERQR